MKEETTNDIVSEKIEKIRNDIFSSGVELEKRGKADDYIFYEYDDVVEYIKPFLRKHKLTMLIEHTKYKKELQNSNRIIFEVKIVLKAGDQQKTFIFDEATTQGDIATTQAHKTFMLKTFECGADSSQIESGKMKETMDLLVKNSITIAKESGITGLVIKSLLKNEFNITDIKDLKESQKSKFLLELQSLLKK